MNSDLIGILFILFLVLGMIFGIIKMAKGIGGYGGGMTNSMFASTYEMYNKEKRAAIEQIVEQKVKKMEERENEKTDE